MRAEAAAPRVHARAIGLLAAFVLVFVLLGAPTAFAITRNTVLTRAQLWIDRAIPYSQARYYGSYRTDCSGFASMCWQTGTSWSTRSFYLVTHTIKVADLRPGDALLKKGYHIRMFYGWVDDAHTMYVTYEQTGPNAKSSIKYIADDIGYGYVPTRYDRISTGAVSSNLLRNGTFDVWAAPKGHWPAPPARPVWWEVTGSLESTLAIRRTTIVKSSRNSIELMNPSTSRHTYTQLSQEVTITPETTYAVGVWARTPAPDGLEMELEYLDGNGESILATRTSGDDAGIDGTGLRQMQLLAVAPANAVRALVTMRLAGGTTAVSTTETVAGTSVVLDDVSLVRPRTTVSIRSNVSHSYIGQMATLSGSISPAAAIGTRAVIYVQKPGSSTWVRLHSHEVYSLSGGAAWKCGYRFARGAAKGVYRFKAELPAFGYWPGATSSTASVTLK